MKDLILRPRVLQNECIHEERLGELLVSEKERGRLRWNGWHQASFKPKNAKTGVLGGLIVQGFTRTPEQRRRLLRKARHVSGVDSLTRLGLCQEIVKYNINRLYYLHTLECEKLIRFKGILLQKSIFHKLRHRFYTWHKVRYWLVKYIVSGISCHQRLIFFCSHLSLSCKLIFAVSWKAFEFIFDQKLTCPNLRTYLSYRLGQLRGTSSLKVFLDRTIFVSSTHKTEWHFCRGEIITAVLTTDC